MTVELLQKLIRIPSVNPDGNPGVDCTGEQELAEFLAEFLRNLGAEVQLHEVLPHRPNVVAKFPSNGSRKPRLLFAPHTDTVSISGMTIDPFEANVSDGRIWGRGASDTKGPMAAMLAALQASQNLIPQLPYEIWFAGLIGEEAGQHGSKALAAQDHFDFVIVGEPTELHTIYTHKGAAWLTLCTGGKAVHASNPALGENAILKMMEAFKVIQDEIAPALTRERDKVLGPSTISIGTISGGSKVNIVPDYCEAQIDVRTIPGQNIGFILDRILNQVPDIKIDVVSSDPLCVDPTHPLIEKLGTCGALPAGASWFCDAAVFAATGMSAVALGPGSIAQAHTADEWISIADLENGTAFFKKFLESLMRCPMSDV